MHDKEITTYLANVLYIASQDGRLTSQELAALDEVRRLVGAKRIHVTEATRLVEDSKFIPQSVGTLGAQVRNLEDMVFVGLADADLVVGEREAIEVFCERIGLTQTQLDQIVREAQVRCSDLELRVSPAPDATESKSDPHDGGRGAGADGAETGHPEIGRASCRERVSVVV
mgnify:CR=1 FL=1